MTDKTEALWMDPTPGALHLVEASAGTGKTWTIEALIVRLVAEYGVPIERILLITFTKAATAQMRARVSGRLAGTLAALRGQPPKGMEDDPIVARLQGTDVQDRLEAAIRDFDRAPISTIHGFCQRMLTDLGVEAGQDPQLKVAADADDILAEMVADALAKSTAELGADEWWALVENGWKRKNLTRVAEVVVSAAAPVIEPAPPAGGLDWTAVSATVREAAPVVQRLVDLLESDAGQAHLANLESLCGQKHGKTPFLSRTKEGTNPAKSVSELLAKPGAVDSERFDKLPLNLCRLAVLEEKWSPKLQMDQFLDVPTVCDISQGIDEHVAAMQKVAAACTDCLAAFAQDVRNRYPVELARRGLLTYDAMLGNLARIFETEGPAADRLATAIRSLYDVGIVDEFQDTDLAQWTTIRRVFLSAGTRLIAVGDPKQSIYGFRGADLRVYSAAADDHAARKYSLARNFRSDLPLVQAINTMFLAQDEAKLMGNGARYVSVDADVQPHLLVSKKGPTRRPVEFRVFGGPLAGLDADKWPTKGPAIQTIAAQCAVECRALCEDGAYTIQKKPGKRGEPPDPSTERPVQPGDIAIIVRTHAQAATVQRALRRAGVACAVGGGRGRLEDTPPTEWVLAWLEALADLSHEAVARRVALTPLIGLKPTDVVAKEAPDGPLADLRVSLGKMAESWKKHDFAFVFNEMLRDRGAWPRILATPSGQRDATDLRNLAEALAATQRRERLTPAGLAEHLRGRRSGEIDDDADADEGGLELESGGNAVRIVTIHSSKGLEYPIVLLPFAWDDPDPKAGGAFLYTKPAQSDAVPRRTLMLGPVDKTDGSPWIIAVEERKARDAEEYGRLLYVALTRAKHHAVVFAGRAKSSRPVLFRLLGLNGKESPKPAGVSSAIESLHAAHPTLIGAPQNIDHPLELGERTPPEPPSPGPVAREWVSKYDNLGGNWRKSSYTALSKGKGIDTRLDVVDSPSAIKTWLAKMPELAQPAPGAVLTGGGETFGKFVHEVLENIDFTSGAPKAPTDEEDPLKALLERLGNKLGVVDEDVHKRVIDAIPGWLATPLHLDESKAAHWSLKDGFHLRELEQRARRDELRFDLSLGGSGKVNVEAVNKLLSDPKSTDGVSESAAAWVDELLNPKLLDKNGELRKPRSIVSQIRGILNGSIDLLFRAESRDKTHRYYLCDYKTNAIKGPESLFKWTKETYAKNADWSVGNPTLRNVNFSAPLLGWEMCHHAYHLQSLLYSVAVHRLLCQRLAKYREGGKASYELHFGGHVYLFLRGMNGKSTFRCDGAALGVWVDRWPHEVVHGLDMALRGKVHT